MSPTPRPLPKPGPGSAPEGFVESAAGSTGPGSGAGTSFATSLAVHGLALATLVMTVKLPWGGSDEEPERTVTCAFEPTTGSLSARVDREPPLELEAPGRESEPLIIEDFELPEEPPFADLSSSLDEEVPEYRRPVREIDPYAAPTLDLTPKPRPKLIRPRSLPPGAIPGPLRKPKVAVAPAPPAGSPINASPEPVEGACRPPIYPKAAERRGWTGTVYLWIDVSASGAVTGVRVDITSGHDVLDEAAMRAVRGWRFKPASTAGVPASGTVRKPIEFSLDGV